MKERWAGVLAGLAAVGLTYGLVSLGRWGWLLAGALMAAAGWICESRVRRWRLLSERDELTGICSRRPFERALAREWQRAVRHGYPLSLLFVDADDFGLVNKMYGHLAGDAVLRMISQQIRKSLRSTDLVARWGGEEFVVLLPDTSVHQALVTAERIRAIVEQSQVRDRGRAIGVTISTGVAAYPGTAETPQELLRQAIEGQSAAKTRKNAVAVVS